MPRRTLSVVIPAYNEEQRLPGTVRAIQAYLDARGYDGEIVAVDDGSLDRTGERLEALRPDCPALRLIRFPVNHGKGFAVRCGMLAATRDAVLFTDADLSTPISEIERFWPAFDEGAAVVIASRPLAASSGLLHQTWRRRVMGRVFNGALSLMGVRGFRDTQCGFKLFRREVVGPLFEPLLTLGFAFDVEILLRARRKGHRVVELPVRWTEVGGSRVDPLRDSARMLRDVWRLRGRL